MVDVSLRNLVSDKDRHGNTRYYVRLPKSPKIRIREVAGTPEFLEAYKAAMGGKVVGENSKLQPVSGSSFKFLCEL